MSENSAEVPAAEGLAAFVLQCLKCKTIVGDSWSYVASNKAWSTITLSVTRTFICRDNMQRSNGDIQGASNVDLIDSSAQTSKRTTDFGSTFKLFRCRSCQELLGRIYKTTSRELDELRDHFTFMMDKVTAYSFGTVEVTANSDSVNENNTSKDSASSSHTPLLLTHDALLSQMQPMEAEILRLKSLCLVFAERLAHLEGEESSPNNKSHIQHSPSLNNSAQNTKSGSALKRRLSEEQEDTNNTSNDARAHKKKRT